MSNLVQLRRAVFGVIKDLKDSFGVLSIGKIKDKWSNINQRISDNEARIIDLETKAAQAKTTLQDHEARITTLEQA